MYLLVPKLICKLMNELEFANLLVFAYPNNDATRCLRTVVARNLMYHFNSNKARQNSISYRSLVAWFDLARVLCVVHSATRRKRKTRVSVANQFKVAFCIRGTKTDGAKRVVLLMVTNDI